MIYSLPVNYKRGVDDFLSHLDREADMPDLLNSVGYDFGVYEDYYSRGDIGGLCNFVNKIILISEDIEDTHDRWEIFAHEFGHIIHFEMLDGNLQNEHSKGNIPFSKAVEEEHYASLIGYHILDWKFPNMWKENRSLHPYFEKRGIVFLQDYYKNFLEDDIKENYEILFGDRQWNFWNNSFG